MPAMCIMIEKKRKKETNILKMNLVFFFFFFQALIFLCCRGFTNLVKDSRHAWSVFGGNSSYAMI